MSGILDTIVTVNISATSATLSVPGTNIPAIVGYHDVYADVIRSYFDSDGMISDGFDSDHPLVIAARSLEAQNPRPSIFKIIKSTTAVAQAMTFKVDADPEEDSVVGLALTRADGTVLELFHTVTTGQTAAQVATALAALTSTGATTDVSGGDTAMIEIDVTQAGDLWYPSQVSGGVYQDVTGDASLDDALDAAVLVDPDFYGLATTFMDETNISTVAAWANANKKLFFPTTADTEVVAAQTGIFDTLFDSGYKRTGALYNANMGGPIGTTPNYAGIGWMAVGLTKFPGSYNWAYKGIEGSALDELTAAQIANAQAKNGNVYINMSRQAAVLDGRSSQGQFLDLQHGIDGLEADIKVSVGLLLVTQDKLHYTRKGMAAVKNAVSGALQRAVDGGFLSNDAGFEFSVTIPDLAQVAPADKQARVLKNVKFVCYAQGAINKVQINGTVNI